MTVDTKEVVTTIAYMIGVRMSALTASYGECAELIDKLKAGRDATAIRYLCKLRTVLMQKFKKTDDLIRFELKNLHNIEWYDHDNIKQLNWEYIRDLFFVPKYNKNGVMKQEFTKYMANIEHYPFQMYIHWQPADVGSVVYSDRKFLKIIYGQHNDSFTDYTKYRDADDETRNNIYEFIDSSEKTAIAVDCENSNPFKLYSVLKGLNQDELAKIEKITLYDDPNTTAGWDWLSKFTQIPVEHIEIDRVTDRKSLVDLRMTASVVTDFYRDGITSFIIVSSDSDFWGLIESLPKAKFLVMYEYEKCGTAIKNALAQHGIYYCAIDDFCTAGTEDMKRAVLFAELEKHLPSLVGENPLDLTHKIYEATRVTATMKEMENFCNRYVKTLRLKVNSEGKFEIEIQK